MTSDREKFLKERAINLAILNYTSYGNTFVPEEINGMHDKEEKVFSIAKYLEQIYKMQGEDGEM